MHDFGHLFSTQRNKTKQILLLFQVVQNNAMEKCMPCSVKGSGRSDILANSSPPSILQSYETTNDSTTNVAKIFVIVVVVVVVTIPL